MLPDGSRDVREALVKHIGVDASGRLVVVPRLGPSEDFAFIYRAAMGVTWDSALRAVVSPAPESWSYGDWFRRIVEAAQDEYGVQLVVDEATSWSVPDEVRHDVESRYRSLRAATRDR